MAAPFKVSPGQTLEGRFHILEEIGRGGMAVVFKAMDLENAGHVVAVKVPRPQYASGLGSWSMFQREAELGSRLSHPAIVRFIGPAASKRPYVVTEYLAGSTLASRIGRGTRLGEAEALRTMSRLCEAVDYLHGRGLVHYDLKPGNVVVGTDGSVRLIDFGTAHEIVKGRFAFVGPAAPFATSDYVAPEQISRRRGQTSVDIYALGAMLYEMLTGYPPFEGDDPFVFASSRQIGDPKAPRELWSAISEEAEEITLRALRRNPRERYPSASAFKADLDNPSTVRVTGLSQRLVSVTPARKRLRLLRFVAIAGLAPVAMMVSTFGLLWWYLARGH